LSATGSGSITVTDDGNGNITISGAGGSGSGTVASPGGTTGKIAKFTGVQTIADSLISDNGTTVTIGGALSVTGSVSLSTPLTVTSGGTGAASAAGARSNLGAAASGTNSDITSLSGLTTALSVAQGGTGIGTLATNGVIVGNGTSPLSSVVAGSSGLCLVSTGGAPAWSACPGSGGVASLNGGTGALTLNNAGLSGSSITINDATTAAKGIASFNSTNFSVSSGAVNTVQNINTTAAPTFGQLALTSSQATNPMLVVNNTNLSASGALLDLQLSGSSKLSVTPAGNVTAAGSLNTGGSISAGGNISTSGNFTGGTLNGQTISSTANFTGSLAVGSTLAVTGGATVSGTLTVSTITPTSSLTIGANGQSFVLQGNASSTLTATSGGNTTTIGFQTPTANVTYDFAAAAAGTYNICTTAGNCVGVGGGVTSPGGTTNKVAKFTGSNAIGDSIISDNGTTVTIGGTLSVNTLTPSGALTVGATGQNLTLQGATVSLSATGSGTTNTLTFAAPSGPNKTITLPNASGTVAVSTSGPLALDANGNLTCPTCLTSGGSGGTAGVSSLNSLTGGLTLQGSSASSITNGGSTITINDASSSVKGLSSFNSPNLTVTSGNVNTVQDITVTSTPTFGGLTLTTALPVTSGGTGATTASGARVSLGAAASGANSDITSLSGLTTALSVAQGGTGITTTPSNGQILIGNGSGYSLNTLSAGSGIGLGHGSGTITISAPGAGTCAGCANTSLSNLSSVAVNTSLLPGTAGAADLGSGTLPFGQLFLAGTSASPATNNFKITGASTGGTRTITLPDASGTVAVSASGNIALSAAGNITFTGTLGVTNGGTGATTLSSNGVLVGNGTGAITSVVAGSGGLCLLSVTSSAPAWSACPGSGGVTSVDSQTGAITISNTSGSGGVITINDASTSAKGIASFNSTNFTVTSGAVNTVQDIASSAAPTFSSLSLTAASSLSLGASSSATGSIVFKGSGGTGTLKLQGPNAPNTGNFTLSLPTITANDTICTVGIANCGVNSVGTIDSQTASSNGAVISGTNIYLQSASATNPGLVNNTSQTFSGDKLFKSASSSTTALQVQNTTGTSVFDVDTTNQRIGIGTNTPGRTFDLSISTTTTNTLPIRLNQSGAGDIGIEYQTSTQNFYEGIDGSDGQFKITSATAANGSFTAGNATFNSADGDVNKIDTYRIQTGATGGTVNSLSVDVESIAASPNNHLQLVIYSDNGSGTAPSTLIGYTASFVPSGLGWNTVSISGVTLAPNTYYWFGFGEDGNSLVGEQTPGGNIRYGATYTFGSPPTTWVDNSSPVTGSGLYAIYANVTPTGVTDEFGGTPLFTLSGTGQAKFQDAVDSTTAFQLQNASGTTLLVADTTNTTIKIAGTTSTFATLQIDNAHFESTQTTAPTAAIATCTGSASITSSSTDAAGSFSAAPTSSAACKVTVTFNKAYAAAPKSVVIAPKSSNFNAVQAYVSSTTTTTFVVTFAATATSGQTYQFYYWVIE
jgi:fibronectin-binding autotransporter adhesin